MEKSLLPDETKAYFIKLGEGGRWEKESIDEAAIKFGYNETDHAQALAGDWNSVEAFWVSLRKKSGPGRSDRRQIQTYYESSERDLFITFHGGYLWWCHPSGEVSLFSKGADVNARVRPTLDGWHNTSLNGKPLLVASLSGKLTKTQMYRGTICEVSETPYLLRRINDEPTPEVAQAEAAEKALLTSLLAVKTRLVISPFMK